MNSYLFLSVAVAVLGSWREEGEHAEFSAFSDIGDRFAVVQRDGDGKDRTAMIAVFEVLGDGQSLRRLATTSLKNPIAPRSREISGDGRFLVTKDDYSYSGNGANALVIYDLVRGENTSYNANNFLSTEVVERLRKAIDSDSEFSWWAIRGAFNQDSTVYFATIPALCRSHGVPNVAIDLPTRIPKVEPTLTENPKNIVLHKTTRLGGEVFHDEDCWTCSTETCVYNSDLYPRRLLRSWPNDNPNQVFELDLATGDYDRVASTAWTDRDPWEKFKNIRK